MIVVFPDHTHLLFFMIVHILKDKHKVAEDINSLNLLVEIFIKTIPVSDS